MNEALKRFLSYFVADGDPPALLIPKWVEDEGPEAVNDFTRAYDILSKYLR